MAEVCHKQVPWEARQPREVHKMTNNSSNKSGGGKGRKQQAKAAEKQVNRVRNIILVALAVIVGGVVSYGLLYSTGTTDKLAGGELKEGNQYTVLEDVPPRRPGTPVEIVEYFSYGCIHCKNFDPIINEFAAGLPDDIKVKKIPVAFSPTWALLAQAYLALEATNALEPNHERLFRAIHDSKRQFHSAEMLADFVDGKGVSREEFLTAFNSPAVRRALGANDAAMRNAQISSVPTLIVDDRYEIDLTQGRKPALGVALQLAERARGTP